MRKAGANFVARERFGSFKENVEAFKDFDVTYTGRSGRKARLEMKKRLAESKAIKPEPVTAGFVQVNYKLAYSL